MWQQRSGRCTRGNPCWRERPSRRRQVPRRSTGRVWRGSRVPSPAGRQTWTESRWSCCGYRRPGCGPWSRCRRRWDSLWHPHRRSAAEMRRRSQTPVSNMNERHLLSFDRHQNTASFCFTALLRSGLPQANLWKFWNIIFVDHIYLALFQFCSSESLQPWTSWFCGNEHT